MARRKIKSPADIAPALDRGALSDEDRSRVIRMGARALPELLDRALDTERILDDDPATLLAQALVEAIGLPPDQAAPALERYLALPESADALPHMGQMIGSAGPVAWELAAQQARAVTVPCLAERLGWVLMDAEGEEVRPALRRLAQVAPERLAWVLIGRADPELLPSVDAALAHLSVPVHGDAQAYDAIHQLVLAARAQGADPARCLMLMQALVERMRLLAEQVVARRDALQG